MQPIGPLMHEHRLIERMLDLLHFYPNHIEKEDKHFFHPVMDFFTREEMDAMPEEYDAFEKESLHEKYNGMIEDFERKKGQVA